VSDDATCQEMTQFFFCLSKMAGACIKSNDNLYIGSLQDESSALDDDIQCSCACV
jgi:hypothetical protein